MAPVKPEIKKIRVSWRCMTCNAILNRKESEPKPKRCAYCHGEICERIESAEEA